MVLGSLPRSFSGRSIFMISAPNAPSQRVAHGPARTELKSTTRIFSRARVRDMVSLSSAQEREVVSWFIFRALAADSAQAQP